MNIRYNIYAIGAALALFTACSDDVEPVYTVGEADNAIVLMAGVADGGSGVQTRAIDDKHGKHVPFTSGTKLRLKVDGTWTGHVPEAITKTTTGTIGNETSTDSKHNEVSFSTTTSPVEQLYWDDYGTADPANATGRSTGLTIYAAAVNKPSVAAPVVSDWTNLTWELPADQKSGWEANDLLTSNNITAETGADGTYKFNDFKGTSGNTPSNLLEFTHAMSKITVNLTAGVGFSGSKFAENPTVTLKNFKYTGSVSIEGKTSTPTDAVQDIQMHLASGGASNNKAQFDALVFPENKFDKVSDKDVDILELTADGNTYIVTAAKLNAAIEDARTNAATSGYPGSDNTLLQGWNYVLNIIVNKTEIHLLATIVNWNDVSADTEEPKIRIETAYGLEPNGTTEIKFTKDFDFFRSLSIGSGYSKDAYVSYETGTDKYIMHDQLYWPTHSTHYFFRSVYPRIGTETGQIPAENISSATTNASNIAVSNVAYETGKYPSDLAIGYPRTTNEKCTHNNEVASNGICATEGLIRMNFRYVMSQVEVILTSKAGNGHVNLDDNTVIKIAGGYTSGNIKLEDGSAVMTGSTGDWTMAGGSPLDRLDAIVPQTLGDMKFVVTVRNAENDYDTYECKIANIKFGDTAITAWEPGKKYVYTLEIQKTGIKVSATIKDWVTMSASENVWF